MADGPMIDDTTIADYDRDGVVCVRSVIDQASVARMLAASLALMDEGPQDGRDEPGLGLPDAEGRIGDLVTTEGEEPGRFFNAVYMAQAGADFTDFAMTSALPAAAAALMRSDVARFFYDQLFIKEPGTRSPTTWHNDMPFWPLTGSDLISCWVALTPADVASSGLEYVAGSHRWNTQFRATFPPFADPAMDEAPDFSLPEHRAGHRILSWDMQPGDVLFHHPLVVHGAGGNASQVRRRVGLSIRYIGADAQWAPRPKAMPLPRDPQVKVGAYPADDAAFPVAWRA